MTARIIQRREWFGSVCEGMWGGEEVEGCIPVVGRVALKRRLVFRFYAPSLI